MTVQLALFDGALDPLRQRRRARGQCHDCGVNVVNTGEMYMVHDHAWPLAPFAGYLCVGCLERRLGRWLTAEDFTDAPVNHRGGHSARLRDRLTTRP